MRALGLSRWGWLALAPLAMPAHAAGPSAIPAPIVAPAAERAPAAAPVAGVEMRVGEHPGFVRLVFDLPRGDTARWSDNDGDLSITFSGAGSPTLAGTLPRLVTQMRGLPGAALLKLVPGVQVRPLVMTDRLVLDLIDPAPVSAPPAEARARPAQSARRIAAGAGRAAALGEHGRAAPAAPATEAAAAPVAPPPSVARPEDANPAQDPPTQRQIAAEPAHPGPDAGAPAEAKAGAAMADTAAQAAETESPAEERAPPAAVAAMPLRPVDTTLSIAAMLAAPTGSEQAAMTLPFAATVGVAAYPGNGSAVIVFDERRPIDLSPLRDDDVLGRAEVRLLPEATVIRLPLEPGHAVRLARRPDGWRVAVVGGDSPRLAPITQDVADGRMHLAAATPGSVVAVPDDETGGTLLVGTQRGAGQAVLVARRMPGFALRADWQGVVVEPITDQLTLRRTADGFIIAADARGLPLVAQDRDDTAQLDAAKFSRRFDLPAAPPAVLSRRLAEAVAVSATAPAQARLRPRLDAAQAMLALGLGAEAQAVVHAAVADAPRGADDPDAIALGAIGALLAGRIDESAGLTDPRLDGSDEIALWRAARTAMREPGAPAAALEFKRVMPLLRAYPAPLRARLLPLALRTMAVGGEAKTVTRLLPGVQEDPDLELPRALALAALARDGGDPATALVALDALSVSPDRLTRARAATEAVALRLDTGKTNAAQAADSLDRLLFSWRGDEREIDLRMRVAELRRQAGEWRQALALLRETEQLWPERKALIHPKLTAAFAEALSQDGTTKMTPQDLVALAEENADLMPDGEAGRALAQQLADRLLTLDLPARAAAVMEKLLATTKSGVARAELAARLADARLAQGDVAGTLDVLGKTQTDDLPAELVERRALTAARATARQGDAAGGARLLADLDSVPALDLRVSLLEQARDWPAAVAAVKAYAAKVLPPAGKLDEQGATVLLREASVAAEAGDDATLSQLRADAANRLPAGRVADMMTLLTGKPAQAIADLPMVAREAAVARAFAATGKAGPAAAKTAATP